MKKTIRDYNLNNKKVIIRCDFNVPVENEEIADDNRIVEAIPTIKYAVENNAKVILLSHFGRVKEEKDKKTNSLIIVAERLRQLLKKEVTFIPYTSGIEVDTAIKKMMSGDIIMLENTRFEDLDNGKESNNDSELGKYWASLGDIFINDAYGASHRAHASTVGIPTYLPSGTGFLVEKEINVLTNIVKDPKHPFTVILGGSKVKDKIGVINNLVNKADKILIGGGMSYTFIKALGYEIGTSLLDESSLDFCKEILTKYKDKIIIPKDVIVTKEFSPTATSRATDIDKIVYNEMGMDIGPQTVVAYSSILRNSKTIFWNGPVGVFEFDRFAVGTRKLCDVLSKTDAITIMGGGDIGAAVTKFGYKDKVTRVSTGGGATLMFLEGKKLPGIEIVSNK
ncbi:MAG: phosphoglycerate kinase [Bacilli bacterium]